MTKDEVIKYWTDASDVDFLAMDSLFSNGHYVWALFVGHLVIGNIPGIVYLTLFERVL